MISHIKHVILISMLASTPAWADNAEFSMDPLPDALWDVHAAEHLLRRAGFSGTPQHVRRLHDMGLDAAVAFLVDYRKIDWALAPPPLEPEALDDFERDEMRSLTDEERQERRELYRRAHQRSFEQVRWWWIDRMVKTPRPFEEKLTLFWHGHFTSGMREVRNALHLLEQNNFLRDHALANFRDLLLGISRDRAMLAYLDNRNNVKRKPNENYARELMELFSLGVGNYSEDDVKAAARAFTGWSFDGQGFVFHRSAHDDGEKRFLGRRGNFDGRDIIDIIIEQPACSRFIARKILEFFVRPDPPPRLVENFALVLRREKLELRPAFKTLFRSRAFFHPASRGALIKSPVELLVIAAREFELNLDELPAAERAMTAMGQELLQPPNVKGWDGKQKWINTATLFNRYNFVGALINGRGDPTRPGRVARRPERPPTIVRRESSAADRPDDFAGEASMTMMSADDDDHPPAPEPNDEEIAARTFRHAMTARSRAQGRPQPAIDVAALVHQHSLSSAEEIVDFFVRSYLAVELPSVKREQLIAYLIGDGDRAFDANSRAAAPRLRTLLNLLTSTPEYQLN